MDASQEQKIVTSYVVREPSRETTSIIVKELSAEFGLKETTLRSILVKAGVYVSASLKKGPVQGQDAKFIFMRLTDDPPTGENRYGYFKALAAEFAYPVSRIEDFAKERGLYPKTEFEINWEQRQKFEAEVAASVNEPYQPNQYAYGIEQRSLDAQTKGCLLFFVLGTLLLMGSCVWFVTHADEKTGPQLYCERQGLSCDKDGRAK